VVVGAGHAGCEAAVACARMGLHTALLTVNPSDSAKMSCNPAIGGIAKGHMVREIDALGGVMGGVTDRAGIQFRMLNRGRGPAVWSPRAQCDKALYSAEMSRLLDGVPGLVRVAGVANRVIRDAAGGVEGIALADGRALACRAAVITPGTFLNGLIHIGPRQIDGGRIGEHAARALSECLADLGLERGRLKTGTPPRLHRDSIDWDVLAIQPGDDPPQPFSHWTERLDVEQVTCWLTATNAETHATIRANLHHSPLYSGAIRGTGPRYCPSIEDKVVKFPERTSHHVFIEPEGRDVPEIYLNGMSSSLPEEVQLQFVRTLRGLEHAEMIRPGYAVEYDFVLPHQLKPTL
jgi:tRNA uridine 5-carboxymethylaminomethyl modification enzyme